MNPTIQKELKKRKLLASKFDLKLFLFKEQLAFVEDPSPWKTGCCSRRSGKTVSCAAHLIHTAISHANVNCLYITLSRNNAGKIVWPELKRINKEYGLGGKVNSVELSITFPNNSVIYLSGAKDKTEIEKFRGLRLKLVYIDEAQSFKSYLKELIDDVIGPALIDHAGTLCLIGTPGPVPAGYFFDCVNSDTWSHHRWTFFDNPHIPKTSNKTHEEILNRELKRRGVDANNPSIRREWFGEWTQDSNSLVLHYDKTKNDYQSLPVGRWNYIMGIDIGYEDADAIVILGWSESSPHTYLVEEHLERKSDITSLVEAVRKLNSKYNCSKLVIDQGGLGKKIAEEIRKRFGIPVEPAEKQRKLENLALLDDALSSGRFKAKANSHFAQDSYLVEFDRDKSTPDKLVISDRYHSDILDAALYAFKFSPAYSYEPPVTKPKPGTPEFYKQETDRMEELAMERAEMMEQISNDDDDWVF